MKILFAQNSMKVRILGVLIGMLLIFGDISYSIGFFIFLAISEVYISILNVFLSQALAQRYYSNGTNTLIFVSRNILLVIPFVLTLVFPELVNIYTAVLGLVYFKVCIYIKYLFFRDKDPK
jgi:hypothetical protein